jgi:hypothetical protein
MITEPPPFRFSGGDAIDGFPTVDGVERPAVRWLIQFDFGDGWKDLGLTFHSKDEAEKTIEFIRRSWDSDLKLRAAAEVEAS